MSMGTFLRELQAKCFAKPLPPRDTFDGQNILVTGGTSGLGSALAIHFANLGASKVIITYRDKSKGEAARQKIEAAARANGNTTVQVEAMELDLSRYSSCVAFFDELVGRFEDGGGCIDIAVLNAGTLNTAFSESPEGWEDSIQANTLSTALLGILLLSWMKDGRHNRQAPPHIVFVNSGRHFSPDISKWSEWEKRDGGILLHFSSASNWPTQGGFDAMYGISKLLMMYALEEICKLSISPDGKYVIESISSRL
ncbi:hypothetical protein ACEQ8H_006715 [Pleosporales sp. CAS-2024a]